MEYIDIYRGAYRIFSRATPLSADCGRLCRGRCCRGGPDAGMILFPCEEQILSDLSFIDISEQHMQDTEVYFAVCNGRCTRALRPLSCRIYPFAPALSGGKISVRQDPRAKRTCPLLYPEAIAEIQPIFFATIIECFEFLRQIPSMDEFLLEYNNMLDEYLKFV